MFKAEEIDDCFSPDERHYYVKMVAKMSEFAQFETQMRIDHAPADCASFAIVPFNDRSALTVFALGDPFRVMQCYGCF